MLRAILRATTAAVSLCAAILWQSCGPSRNASLADDIAGIPAIDNHAHPVSVAAGDREFDALPVDNMEPASDPVYLRPGAPGILEAWQALFHYPYTDLRPEHARQLAPLKKRIMDREGDRYPVWVLDQMGVDVMLANRVSMARGIAPPRFRWVPYADALLFPLDNGHLAAKNSDRKAFFTDEDALRRRYLTEAGFTAPPATLDEYLTRVVTPTLERHKQGGAVAEKFEAAYLRSLDFAPADKTAAAKVYAQYHAAGTPPDADYKLLQDYLFRHIATECGRLGMAVHIHTMAGAGSYFEVAGANPLLMESVLNDPALRKTNFVMLHGGWPFTREIMALLEKPNAFLDYSAAVMILPPATLAATIREWLEFVPEKVMFATDAYPYSEEMGWEESGWIASHRGREALVIALDSMLRDREISRDRALELARMVLRGNAQKLYGL